MMIRLHRLVGVFVLLCLLIPLHGVPDGLERLRFSLPPRMGAIPIVLADQWGLYDQHGVTVELQGLPDNQARSLAMMTGAIDGMVCDVVTAILLAMSGADIVITSTIHQPQSGSLALLTRSYYGIWSIGDLLARTVAGNMQKSIGVIQRSDLEYHLDMLLTSLGYAAEPDKDYWGMYDLLQLATFLSLGSVYAAVLPEPYTTYIEFYPLPGPSSTLVHLSDFEGIIPLPEIVVFRREVIDRCPQSIDHFYAAVEEAIERINASDRETLIEVGVTEAIAHFFHGASREDVPQIVLDNVEVPRFDPPQMLSEASFEGVVAWLNAKHYTWKRPAYEEMTTGRFVR